MVKTNEIDNTFNKYIIDKVIPCGILLVRKDGKTVYKNKWGYSDIENHEPVRYDSLFRMMSMTKPITAAAIMKLFDEGKVKIDDPVSKYIPSFKNSRVVCDRRYPFPPKNPIQSLVGLITYNKDKVKTIPSKRDITIRDLLSHSSGLEQGIGGYATMLRDKTVRTTNAEQAEKYAKQPLDFEPGTGTGYSPIAGFDVLISVIESASGEKADDYFRNHIFLPLDMNNSTFHPTQKEKENLVQIYKKSGKSLKNVTGKKADMKSFFTIAEGSDYVSGSGGLYSTAEDYEHFAQMLLDSGVYNGKRILSEESVKLMQTEAPKKHLEPEPGFVWGLGVKIRQDPIKGKTPATEGTFGWSGAYGTHFFVSPKDNMECVFMTNVSNIGGSSSKVSQKVEELVFNIFK